MVASLDHRLPSASHALGGVHPTLHSPSAKSPFAAGRLGGGGEGRASTQLPPSCFAAAARTYNTMSTRPSDGGSAGGTSTSYAAAASEPSSLILASADEGKRPLELVDRMYAVALGSRGAAAGGLAGIVARTASAPLDRIKLLFQVQAMEGAGISKTAYTGVGQAFAKIYREEGILAFWKGNGVNVIRVAPYAAAQLSSNDFYKSMLAGESGKLGLKERLVAGAMAGMTGTALTHPLDTIRLRLALPNHGYTGISNAFYSVATKEGVGALYKGLIPTLAGIAPYAAINFASYDMVGLRRREGARARGDRKPKTSGVARVRLWGNLLVEPTAPRKVVNPTPCTPHAKPYTRRQLVRAHALNPRSYILYLKS